MFWAEVDEYGIQEPSSAQALDFAESIEFIVPGPTANGAAEAEGSLCESVLLECKHLVHREMVRGSFKWKV